MKIEDFAEIIRSKTGKHKIIKYYFVDSEEIGW